MGLANSVQGLLRLLGSVLLLALVFAFGAGFFTGRAFAQEAPSASAQYRAELTRVAHAVWGLDAPVPVFAAQLHQESAWNPAAVSKVGALGMAQFMPATARWWCDLHGLSAAACQPSNPTWAMRALVGYNHWLYLRVDGATEYDRLWAMLRSYNGGLGNWRQEAAMARPDISRAGVDMFCGEARRSRLHCPENLGYPRKIMQTLQPRYVAWGREVVP